ncbi:uncharacterized protein EV154DRAFT_489131 [Mucor mucedo]|uniref:uncharacterized protein n=1 Tax=Mucor mucedo TaxID=29922 RepID=UPI0022210C8F|nr:uncharacterized protein EV154DRAFT_489131 [Mucor mucedo]KAI7862970.1 hypothetical protein EV154DRAFT_489131 [Mucor mucedo]
MKFQHCTRIWNQKFGNVRCPRLLQTDSIAEPDSEVTGRESQQNGEPQTVVDGKNSYKSKCGHVIILPFMFKPVYVFYSLPSASGLAFRHELKIKRAQRRMSDDRCQNKYKSFNKHLCVILTLFFDCISLFPGLENIEITDLMLPLRALWLSQKTALSFKIYLLLLRGDYLLFCVFCFCFTSDQEHNWDNKSKEVFFMKESTLFLNGQRLKV